MTYHGNARTTVHQRKRIRRSRDPYRIHARALGVSVATVGMHEVAVAVVSLPGRAEETLVGSAVVRDDPREAVVRAVLDAINRPVSWLVGRKGP